MNFELINIVAARTSVIIKIVQTPIGDAVFAATKDRLFLSNFVDNYVEEKHLSFKIEKRFSSIRLKSNSIIEIANYQLVEFLGGFRKDFTVPLLLYGTSFQKIVWNKISQISYGETRTYSQVATEISKARAGRAVGQAIARNPLLIFVPCHRIVSSKGDPTGYSGKLWRKQQLLAYEHNRKKIYGGVSSPFNRIFEKVIF